MIHAHPKHRKLGSDRLLLSAALFLSSAWADAMTRIPIDEIFIPQTEYDANPSIEVVVMGQLPNPCFSPAPAHVRRLAGDRFRLSVVAAARHTGACTSGYSQDDPTVFQSVVSLGHLDEGSYLIEFRDSTGTDREQTLRVARASRPEAEPEYAAVHAIAMDTVFLPGESVRAIVRGVRTSSCQGIAPPQIRVAGNTIVVLPIAATDGDSPCVHETRPFSLQLDLGRLAPGSYLLQVCARSGKRLYQTFEVLAPGAAAPELSP